jgi:hypothetical protein
MSSERQRKSQSHNDMHIADTPSPTHNTKNTDSNSPKTSHKSQERSSEKAACAAGKEIASRMSIFGRVAVFSAFWMTIAFCLKLFLEPSLEGKIFDIFVQILFCFLTLAMFDILLCCKSPARWFILHALGNFIIVFFSITDTVRRSRSIRDATLLLGYLSSILPSHEPFRFGILEFLI